MVLLDLLCKLKVSVRFFCGVYGLIILDVGLNTVGLLERKH